MTDSAEHAGTIANHWWWRPGWRRGRRMYTFHITFDGLPEIGALASRVQARLARLSGLDLVPIRWLHLTTQAVGFADEVPDGDVAAVIAAARRRLAAITPPDVTIGPARIASEGIACGVTPAGALDNLRDSLRAAIGDARGPGSVPEDRKWMPHVSLAYSRVTGPADIYAEALDGEDSHATVRIAAVQLIALDRGEHVYTWTTVADILLPGAPPAS